MGVPVGFVGAVESKEALTIAISRGCRVRRKGGSNVAAAIVNALLITPGGLMGELSFDAPVWHHGKALRKSDIPPFRATAAGKSRRALMQGCVNI